MCGASSSPVVRLGSSRFCLGLLGVRGLSGAVWGILGFVELCDDFLSVLSILENFAADRNILLCRTSNFKKSATAFRWVIDVFCPCGSAGLGVSVWSLCFCVS